MASRGQSVTVTYVAWNTSTNAGQTGDVLNHTLRVVKDGTSAAPTNSASEVDSVNAPGVYKLTLTATEATADCVVVCGKSSTANVSIMPITVMFEQLPTAAPTAAGGVRDAAFINGVATSSVTTVNANLGTTTAIAFGADNLPKVGLWGFLGTLFTESVGGNIAAAFKKAFDVASSVWTTASVNQTGDSFARIGANGGALTALAPAATALSNVNWTNALAGLLNTLAGHDPGGTLASAASQTSILNAVNAITTNTSRTSITLPQFQPLPASGSTSVLVKIKLFNLEGQLEDADTNTVTIHAATTGGVSLDANLSATTATRDGAGEYHVNYSVLSTAAEGGVYLSVTYTVGGVSMAADAAFSVAQADTVTSIASILSTVNTINTNVGTAGAGLTVLSNAIALCQQAGAAVTLPAIPANWITAAGINAGALDGKGDWATAGAQMDLVNAPNATALAAIANAYLNLANGIEMGITPLQAERAMLAVLCGKLTVSGSNPEVFQNPAGTANRVSVANDTAGNRTVVTITA